MRATQGALGCESHRVISGLLVRHTESDAIALLERQLLLFGQPPSDYRVRVRSRLYSLLSFRLSRANSRRQLTPRGSLVAQLQYERKKVRV